MRGQGAELPCGVWGNAPTVPRATSMPNALNKGAGSHAALPASVARGRRPPKLVFPISVLSLTKWAPPTTRAAHVPPIITIPCSQISKC